MEFLICSLQVLWNKLDFYGLEELELENSYAGETNNNPLAEDIRIKKGDIQTRLNALWQGWLTTALSSEDSNSNRSSNEMDAKIRHNDAVFKQLSFEAQSSLILSTVFVPMYTDLFGYMAVAYPKRASMLYELLLDDSLLRTMLGSSGAGVLGGGRTGSPGTPAGGAAAKSTAGECTTSGGSFQIDVRRASDVVDVNKLFTSNLMHIASFDIEHLPNLGLEHCTLAVVDPTEIVKEGVDIGLKHLHAYMRYLKLYFAESQSVV